MDRLRMAAAFTENAREAFQRADDLWSAELHNCFGKQAGDKRYTAEGKGAPGSVLRVTHDAFERARDAWFAAREAERNAREA